MCILCGTNIQKENKKRTKHGYFSIMYLHKKFQILLLLLPQKYIAVQYYCKKL